VPADYKRGGDRVPIGLVVRLAHGSAGELVERYAVNISRGGFFVRTREPWAVGTDLGFELRLESGEKVVRGRGIVRWVALPGGTYRHPGMGVEFLSLDRESEQLIERMVKVREKRGLWASLGEPPPPPKLAPAAGEHRPAQAQPPASPIQPATPAQPPVTSSRPPEPARPVRPAGTLPDPTPPPLALKRPSPPPDATVPAQADLSAAHPAQRIEQRGAMAVELGLPAKPAPVGEPSKAIIGIDLGTTNSCAALVVGGKPFIVPSREGHNTVPSIVALNTRGRIVVGHLAKAQLLTNPRSTVHGAKRLVGRPWDSVQVQQLREKFAYEIVAGEDGFAAVKLGEATLSLEQVSALVLKEVREVAQNHLGAEVNRAVITVPAYYNERQRAAVRAAGALAGLRVERILNEPTAAALAYAHGRTVQQRVLVYDLGGGTFDASVLELNGNVYEVVSTGGDPFLGGVDFDNRIVDRLLELYQQQVGRKFDGDRVALSRMVDAAERAKCALSERQEFQIDLPYLALVDGKPIGLKATLSRAEIQELVEPLVDRTIEVCREVLAARSLSLSDLDEVILVGGQSRMPLVHRKVEAFFGRAPSHAVHPDEAVALGAALLAHSWGTADGPVLVDVVPMSIGIGLPGGRVKTIIERNTSLPIRKQYSLSTSRDEQEVFELVVLQGEGPTVDACEYLGTLTLSGLPKGPRGMVKVGITFELGAECLLEVTAKELHSGRTVNTSFSMRDGVLAARKRLGMNGVAREAGAPAAIPAPAPIAPAGPAPVASPSDEAPVDVPVTVALPLAPRAQPAPAAPPPAAPRRRGLFGVLRRLFGGSAA
jgi:molecular chaperone DnaK